MYKLEGVSYNHINVVRTDSTAPVVGVEINRLSIARTGITAIIGPSGSGKTTFLSLLAGFLKPEISPGGRFTFDERDLAKERLRPGDVAFVFQSSLLLSASSAGLNMLQGHVASGHPVLDVGRVRHMAERLGLQPSQGDMFRQRARHLSGGEAQRVSVLRALATEAQAILCDEPTSSLDTHNARQVLGALKEWSETRPVIWVTHGLEDAAQHADRFVFLRNGRIVTPGREIAENLAAGDVAQRLAALRKMAEEQNEETVVDAVAVDGLTVPRSSYLRWIANALSQATWCDKGMIGTTQTPAENRVLQRIAPGIPTARAGILVWPLRMLRFVLGYSCLPMTGLLFIMVIQVFLALSVMLGARTYIDSRLQDFSVARLSFERVIGNELDSRPIGDPLDFQSLSRIEVDLRGVLDPDSDTEDQVRIVFGLRHERHAFRAAEAVGREAPCDFGSFQTVVVDPSDPILNQASVTRTGHKDRPEIGTELASIILALYDKDRFAGVALVTRGAHDRLAAGGCADPDAERFVLEWNAAQGPPYHRLGHVFVVEALPATYPYFPDILIFENDYQNFARILGANPPSFNSANAYFPLDAFGLVRGALEARGYVIKDDTESAVDLLRQMAAVFRIVPIILVALNGIAAVAVLIITLSTLLELNKRVLTLFRAYGFRLCDMVTVMLWHLGPAFMMVLLAVLLAGEVLWYLATPLFEAEIGPLIAERYRAHIIAAGGFASVSLVTVIAFVGSWWKKVGRHLSDYLKE